MLNILHDFKKELEKNKAELLTYDFTTEIENAVKTYRNELRATKEEERKNTVAKINSDLECIDRVIEKMIKTQNAGACDPTSVDGLTVKTIS